MSLSTDFALKFSTPANTLFHPPDILMNPFLSYLLSNIHYL